LWYQAAAAVWFLAVVHFFRDPQRFPPGGQGLILAPADGRVISVGDATDSPLSPPGQRISIFMSPLDVHVNRAPMGGLVTAVVHRRGRFLSAFKPDASRENEHTLASMDTAVGEIALKQIAGFLARRIVFHPRPGDRLRSGDRIGMIRFGSRVDLFLPDLVKVRIKTGDRVTAGETRIGEFSDAKTGAVA
jgi:phosphatidylserine decarboxylase